MKLQKLPKTFIIGLFSGILIGTQIYKIIAENMKKKEKVKFVKDLEGIKLKNAELISDIENLTLKSKNK